MRFDQFEKAAAVSPSLLLLLMESGDARWECKQSPVQYHSRVGGSGDLSLCTCTFVHVCNTDLHLEWRCTQLSNSTVKVFADFETFSEVWLLT